MINIGGLGIGLDRLINDLVKIRRQLEGKDWKGFDTSNIKIFCRTHQQDREDMKGFLVHTAQIGGYFPELDYTKRNLNSTEKYLPNYFVELKVLETNIANYYRDINSSRED